MPSPAQPGACPPPASPQAVQAGAVRGTRSSCCPIFSSSRVISSLIASISRRCVLISKAWMSRNRPVSASSSSLRVALSRVSPSAASAAGLRSPATRASRNRRPLAPNKSEITTEIFSSASSRIFSTRAWCRAWSWASRARVRVSARRSRTGCGGTNERRSIPRSFSLHSHTQSARSLLPRPGRCLTSRALTSHTCSPAASAR